MPGSAWPGFFNVIECHKISAVQSRIYFSKESVIYQWHGEIECSYCFFFVVGGLLYLPFYNVHISL